MSATPPVYTPPTLTIPAVPAAGSTPLSAGSGNIPVLDYSAILGSMAVSLAQISYELQLINFNQTVTEIPGTPGAINQAAAGALNDMTTLMAEMLEQQIVMKGNIASISNALATIGGTMADGVATQQILTVATIKKQEKDIAETEAALARQNPPIAPQVISPAALTQKITGTVTDTGILAAQSKASGLASTAVNGALERGTNIVSNWFSGSAISEFFSKNVATIGAAKTAEPAPVAAATTAKTAATTRTSKLGL